MLKLKRYDFSLKGGYQYVQPETGMKFDGNTPFKSQVATILTHRKRNNLARATWNETLADLEAYTCARMPGQCKDTTGAKVVVPRVVRGCGSCGGRRKK